MLQRELEVDMTQETATDSLLRGNEITIHHDSDEIRVTPAEQVTVPVGVGVLREE